MYGNSENLDNSLTASIDWIAFTSTVISNVSEMISFLGYTETDFLLLSKGANGYKRMHRLEGFPITILSDGNEGMGIHVVISGSAIPDLLIHFKNSLIRRTSVLRPQRLLPMIPESAGRSSSVWSENCACM